MTARLAEDFVGPSARKAVGRVIEWRMERSAEPAARRVADTVVAGRWPGWLAGRIPYCDIDPWSRGS